MQILSTEMQKNVFELYNKSWALLTSGDKDDFNTMTISWGGLGHLWRKDVAYVYVRPTRYTYEYIEKNDYFTVSFFGEEYREDLTYLGKNSGRDEDKLAKTSLTPTFVDGTVIFDQAEYVMVCKKVHSVDITREQFNDKETENVYTNDNLHKQYIGVIEKVYKK